MIVDTGVAVTVGPEAIFNPVDGDHAYVPAPLAVSTTEVLGQIGKGTGGVMLTMGRGFTVTTTRAVFVQPDKVPVTV